MKPRPDDLALWRKQQRAVLIARREALDPATLEGFRRSIDSHLELGFPGLVKGTLGICWPYRNEYDARHLGARLRRKGVVTALPVVQRARAPLLFCEWHPGVKLAEGVLGIRYPVDSAELVPDAVLVPVVGFDGEGYRLGYGGGFFDRTLASMPKRPVAIGVGFELCRLDTIFPEPFDIPMDYIVTEQGIYQREPGGLAFLGAPLPDGPSPASPVCYAGELPPHQR